MLVAILATAFTYQAATGTWDGRLRLLTLRGFGFDPTFQLFCVPGLLPGLRHQGAHVAVPHLAARTRTWRRPRPARSSWPACCSSWAATGSSASRCRSTRRRRTTWRGSSSCLSLIAIIYGAIVAIVQPDLKKLIAYSSVSHMGFVTLGIFVFQEQGLQGAVLQMVNHGVITGALFLCVGVIYERTHDRTIAKMGGLAARTPVYAAIFGFFMLASLGPAGPGRLRGRVPGLPGHVRGLAPRGRHRHARDGLRGRLPDVDVPARRVRRAQRLPQGPRPPPHGHRPGRGADAHATVRARILFGLFPAILLDCHPGTGAARCCTSAGRSPRSRALP